MFGRTKMYKKGLADAMAADQSFMEKQQAAIEHMRQEVRQGKDAVQAMRDMLQDDIGNICDYLSAKEKAELYKLASPFDIKELGESEKLFLAAVLCQLAQEQDGVLTQSQHMYISSVLLYLGVGNPQMGADLHAVENIDSVGTQKAFMQVALEFFYLQDSDELTEQQEEFLSFFSLNRGQAEAIERNVAQLYHILGPEGLAVRYGMPPAEKEEKSEEKPAAPAAEDWCLPDPARLEELTLSRNLEIAEGEQKVYRDVSIFFQARIECKGSLAFENCVLRCDGTDGEIVVSGSGALRMECCRVQGQREQAEDEERYFITAEESRTPISVERCGFSGSGFFLNTKRDVVLKDSSFTDVGAGFIDASQSFYSGDGARVIASGCRFTFPNWSHTKKDRRDEVIECQNAEFARCEVVGDVQIGSAEEAEQRWDEAREQLVFLSAMGGWITQCSFRGVGNVCRIGRFGAPTDRMVIARTVFEHCVNGVEGPVDMSDCRIERATSACVRLGSGSRLTNCQFNDCYRELVGTDYDAAIKISRCEFNSWEGKETGWHTNGTFASIIAAAMLRFSFSEGSDEESEVSDCVFNGIQAYDNFIVIGSALKKVKSWVVRVRDCRFINCRTDRESRQLIKKWDTYTVVRWERKQMVVWETDNTGLDDVNTGSGHNDNVQRMMTTAAGEPIGVELALPQN